MELSDNKLKLEPTAALVMKWALSLYRKNPALEFVNKLDLSSGTELYQKCCSVCDWYDEVILNRKKFYQASNRTKIDCGRAEIPADYTCRGKSPMAIEIMSNTLLKSHRILEIDISGMDDKQCIYNNLFPEYADKMKMHKIGYIQRRYPLDTEQWK